MFAQTLFGIGMGETVAMTETDDKTESAPIIPQTRVPTDDPVEESDSAEDPETTPIATSTRVP